MASAFGNGFRDLRVVAVVFVALFCPHLVAEIRISTLTSAAGFVDGIPVPGSIGTIFCSGLTGIDGIQSATGSPLPTQLSGVAVEILGVKAPILAVANLPGYQQINFQMPNPSQPVGLNVVVTQGTDSGTFPLPTNTALSAFFSDAQGFGIVQHASDGSLVSADRPAKPGEWLTAYGTGFLGNVKNAPPVGYATPFSPLFPLSTEAPGIGHRYQYEVHGTDPTKIGMVREVGFIGLTPGFAGLYQANFRLADTFAPGVGQIYLFRRETCIFGTCPDPVSSVPVKIYLGQ